jgi:hypothetical protein
MEDLPDALLGEIIKRLTSTSDLNSFSLVSKKLYTVEAELRDAIRVGCGACPVTVALAAIGSRFFLICVKWNSTTLAGSLTMGCSWTTKASMYFHLAVPH